jgi:tetratricopeptide (TPR) repeat protein
MRSWLALDRPPIIAENPLAVPDDVSWWPHRKHSRPASHRLTRAFDLLARARTADAFEQVLHILRPCLRMRMMPLQELQVFYMHGVCAAGLGAYSASAHWVNKAIDLASQLEQQTALPQLYLRRSTIARMSSRFDDASRDCFTALDHFEWYTLEARKRHRTLRLSILVPLILSLFYRARYHEARTYLFQAKDLAPLVPNSELDSAMLLWYAALLDRWQGRPQRAFEQAVHAVETVRRLSNVRSLVRLDTVIADSALDVAAQLPVASSAPQRTRYLAAADAALTEALPLAQSERDLPGEALTIITRARLSRLRGENPAAAERDIAFGLDTAHAIADVCLFAQSLTARGDLRQAQGAYGDAISDYRYAAAFARGVGLPAVAAWAESGMRWAEEWRE